MLYTDSVYIRKITESVYITVRAMKSSCPACKRSYGFFSGPQLQSWGRDPLTDCYCPYCKVPLKIEKSLRFTLVGLSLLVILCVSAYGTKLVLWQVFDPSTALAVWGTLVVILIILLIMIITGQIKYVQKL